MTNDSKQSWLAGYAPADMKNRFLELSSKPETYTLTALRPGGYVKQLPGGKGALNVLAVLELADDKGRKHDWELAAKGAWAQLRPLLERHGPAAVGSLKLRLSASGSGKDRTYTVAEA